MKNAPTFLSGCVVGTLVTFTLYFCTVYLTQLTDSGALYAQLIHRDLADASITTDLDEETTGAEQTTSGDVDMFAGVKSWVESTLMGAEAGAYTSVIHITTRNFLLPIVYSSIIQKNQAMYLVNSTWGQRTDSWTLAVGASNYSATLLDEGNVHLLLAKKCQNFLEVSISEEQLFCLLTAIHDSYIDKYQWFVVFHKSTYVAVNQLVKTLLQFDSSETFYIGKPSTYSITEMTKLGLVSHERICQADAGLILSRAALKRIVPHLQSCQGLGLSRGLRGKEGEGDVELGRCISRRLGVTCSHSLMVCVCVCVCCLHICKYMEGLRHVSHK